MPDYERIPADADAVGSAREVKSAYSETWADVFRFYAEHRGELGESSDETPQGFVNIAEATEAELDELATEIRRLREQVERVPEDTAEALGERFA